MGQILPLQVHMLLCQFGEVVVGMHTGAVAASVQLAGFIRNHCDGANQLCWGVCHPSVRAPPHPSVLNSEPSCWMHQHGGALVTGHLTNPTCQGHLHKVPSCTAGVAWQASKLLPLQVHSLPRNSSGLVVNMHTGVAASSAQLVVADILSSMMGPTVLEAATPTCMLILTSAEWRSEDA
jgi:hypothetical protein